MLSSTLKLKTEKMNAHSGYIGAIAYYNDGTLIVSGSHDRMIKVWDSGAFSLQNRYLWPQLTPPVLPHSHAGAQEREGQRPQRLGQLGSVFPRRDQDRVRIGRQDDQSLGFRCVLGLKSPFFRLD